MKNETEDLLVLGAAALAGILAREALETVWEHQAEEPPPENPAEPGTGWRRALLWGAAVGIAVGLARAVALRGASGALESRPLQRL